MVVVCGVLLFTGLGRIVVLTKKLLVMPKSDGALELLAQT